MGRFIVGRLFQSFVTLLLISVLVFGLVRLTGNPVDMLLPIEATPEMRTEMSRQLGIDRPLWEQYGYFLGDLVRGDLGTSIRARRPVTELLMQRLPNSLELVGISMLIALVIAFPLGVLAATRRGSLWDGMARGTALFGQSIPTFWAGIVLIYIFAISLGWFPAGGSGGPLYVVLPALTLGLFGFMLAGVVRLLRGSMIEVLDSEFVKFARIKGVPERTVIWKHALKNAMIPVVTFVGFYFGILISGTVVVETVFAWPGIGRLAYEAVQWRDYPVIQGIVLLVSAITLLTNLAVDVLYAWLDPRIRYG
jgi:peptide/nickel transport system permease protein